MTIAHLKIFLKLRDVKFRKSGLSIDQLVALCEENKDKKVGINTLVTKYKLYGT